MTLDRQIDLLLCLPLASIDKMAVKHRFDKIGASMEFDLRARAGIRPSDVPLYRGTDRGRVMYNLLVSLARPEPIGMYRPSSRHSSAH